jgi:hypothetical protein
MKALKQLHLGDSQHLLWVRVNAAMGDHIPEQFSLGHTKCALLRVQLHLEFSQVVEGLCQVRDEYLFFLSLYDHVVNIRFCVMPNL